MDFDVHHGNGTEAIVRNLVPSTHSTKVKLFACENLSWTVCCLTPEPDVIKNTPCIDRQTDRHTHTHGKRERERDLHTLTRNARMAT